VYFSFRGAAWLAERLPIRMADRIAALVADLTYRAAKSRRRIVGKNLTRVVGPQSPAALQKLVRQAFRSYAEYWLETFRLGRYTAEDLQAKVDCDQSDRAAMEQALSEGKGVLLITAHFGSYDLGSAWIGTQGWAFTTVGEVLRPRALFEWFSALRSRWGMKVVGAEKGRLARQISRILSSGEGLALVSDRDLGRRGLWAEFYGERTTIPATPPLLMARQNLPLICGGLFKQGDRFRVVFERIHYDLEGRQEEDAQSCAQVVASALEGLINRAPEQWHLFGPNWPSDEPNLPPRGRESE